jgi:hypothetical protein
MTTYKNTEFTTAEDLRNTINSDLAALAYPYAVKHRTYGEGQLTFIKAPLIGGSLYATVDFAAGTKTLALDVILANNLLEMPEELMEAVLEAQTVYKADFIEREQAQRTADRLAYEQKKAAEKQAAEDKKNEEKYERTKAKAIRDFEVLASADRPVEVTNEFFYSLGWLAKHIGVITAKLPDYLGSSFEKHFGTEAPKTLVDGRAKTIGGHAKQWSWEFVASIKKLKDTIVPAYIQNTTTDISKGIHNTSFVWDLVDNYGFQFGKKQDVEKIRSHVPTNCLASFEAGLA